MLRWDHPSRWGVQKIEHRTGGQILKYIRNMFTISKIWIFRGCTLLFMFQWNWIFSINQKSSGACFVYRNLRENIKVILESIFLKVITCRILLEWHALWHIKSGYIFLQAATFNYNNGLLCTLYICISITRCNFKK